MTERMPDFAMPSDDEVAAERRAMAARGAVPQRVGPADEVVDRDEAASPTAAAADDAVAADPSTRARPAARRRDVLRGRVLATARRPIVAFVAGAALVAAGFLAVPALTTLAERGSAAQLRQVVAAYVDAIERGDVEAVLALEPDDDRGSLALLEAGVEPTSPVAVDCDEPETTERETAFVDCTVTVPGSMMGPSGEFARIRLDRVDGAWRIASGMLGTAPVDDDGGIELAPVLEVVAIAGVSLAEARLPDDAQPLLLPGAYDVEVRVPDRFEVEDFGGLVMTPAGGSVQVAAVADESLRDEAQSMALAFVEACLVDDASARACGVSRTGEEGELDATSEGFGYATAATSYLMQVSVHGSGSPLPLVVEVELELADDGAITMRVASVQGTG